MTAMVALDSWDRRLVSAFQSDFPLVSEPFSAIDQQLGMEAAEVRQRLTRLIEAGVISRVGAVIQPNRVGVSTLAAMAVPPERLEQVAALISARPEVNHNYEREHRFNLWFVVTANDHDHLASILEAIALATGISPLDLPMIEAFHIDLGFDLAWS